MRREEPKRTKTVAATNHKSMSNLKPKKSVPSKISQRLSWPSKPKKSHKVAIRMFKGSFPAFKKLKLFQSEVKALGVTHSVSGHIRILEDRIKKIAQWPRPQSQTEVRSFLGVVGITRRWVKNFAELARPLTRLTGKIDWRGSDSEELSFEILRVKCTTRTSMHGIDLTLPVLSQHPSD